MSSRPTTPDLSRTPVELQFQALHAQLERVRRMQHRYDGLFHRLVFLAVASLVLMAAASMTTTLRAVALLIPFFVVWVGAQAAYFLSYVVLARVYATGLEQSLNDLLGGDALIAHRLEAAYLFPLGGPHFSAVPLRADQTFIGFMTIRFWLLGAAVFALGAYRAWQLVPLVEREFPPAGYYFPALIFWALLHLVYLLWYFGTGYHERRAVRIVRDAYGTSFDQA